MLLSIVMRKLSDMNFVQASLVDSCLWMYSNPAINVKICTMNIEQVCGCIPTLYILQLFVFASYSKDFMEITVTIFPLAGSVPTFS